MILALPAQTDGLINSLKHLQCRHVTIYKNKKKGLGGCLSLEATRGRYVCVFPNMELTWWPSPNMWVSACLPKQFTCACVPKGNRHGGCWLGEPGGSHPGRGKSWAWGLLTPVPGLCSASFPASLLAALHHPATCLVPGQHTDTQHRRRTLFSYF